MRSTGFACVMALTMGACEQADNFIPAKERAGVAPPNIAGRWQFASSAGTACTLTLGGGPIEGTVTSEGDCSWNVVGGTWTFAQGSLIIRDHAGRQLAQLSLTSPGRFDSLPSAGMHLTMTR